MIQTALLGFARMGRDRELKRALEGYWASRTTAHDLTDVASAVRRSHLQDATNAGINVLPSNDFTLYDHVLDHAIMLGAIPARFSAARLQGLDLYFAMARGTADVPPLEMTKWLDTNYHYLVPEIEPDTVFSLDATKPLQEFQEALAWGFRTRPVLIGPVSFLLLSKSHLPEMRPLTQLDKLIPVYEELLTRMTASGVTEVQIDEPCLIEDRTEQEMAAVEMSWSRLAAAAPALQLTLVTYFDGMGTQLERVLAMPATEFHLDCIRAPEQLTHAVRALRPTQRLSLGIIDGRNIWAADLDAVLTFVEPAVEQLGPQRVRLAPSCSLQYIPYSAAREESLDAELRSWLAFADEKMAELQTLAAAVEARGSEREKLLAPSRHVRQSRQASPRLRNPAVRQRIDSVQAADLKRQSPYRVRTSAQAQHLSLPDLPTSTIGSFPQTTKIREMRQRRRASSLPTAEYEAFLQDEIRSTIKRQEELGLDVLVHGEAERTDMIEYFAELLDGFAISQFGWVQSYGSRCVKPPILYGEVSRPAPMTVRWWEFAQSCSSQPVKGMLTGPVTILRWSFVRDDQPIDDTCRQIALAVRDETLDLQHAGAKVIQIDEPAIREGLPHHHSQHDHYLRWAIDCFRLAANGVADTTQLHTHMCYSQFNEIIEHIARMDADVISIEASRSQMDLLDAFADFEYPNAVGPGVYDIHSPRIPSVDEIVHLLELAETRIARNQLWVNPDCGLKTRTWDEVLPSLRHMVEAAARRRAVVPARV